MLIFTDSKYVVDSVKKDGYLIGRRKPSRIEKFRFMEGFLIEFRKHKVDFKWIKGHNNHYQNDRCDTLAVEASKNPVYLLIRDLRRNEADGGF